MTAKVDANGRIELPDTIKRQLGIQPGDLIELDERGGEWVIRPVSGQSSLRWEGDVLVFGGVIACDLERAICESREERIDELTRGVRP